MKKSSRKKKANRTEISISCDTCDKCGSCCSTKKGKSGCGSCFYFLGFLGAAVYYIQAATGFWNGVGGFLKAIVWPAFMVYDVLKFVLG